jgi:hypothetical protein
VVKSVFVAALAWGAVARAAPAVEFFFPAGGQQGTTVTVTAGGKFDVWPALAWTDSPGLTVKAGEAKGTLVFEIGKDVPPGPHLVRVFDPTGPAAPRVFTVGAVRELAEAEPNDEVAKAQGAPGLPLVVNGRLEKTGDVDSYAVKLEAGQTLTAAVEGRRAGAPMDPLLHLFDGAGNQVAFAHDGLGLDPILVYRAERADTFVVRVCAFAHPPAADIKLVGGPPGVYRLSLAVGAPVRYAFPAGVRRGTKSRVQLFPWGAAADAVPATVEVDATGAGPGEQSLPAGDATRVELGDGPELAEPEWKSAGSAAVAAPAAVTGRVEQDGEEDGYLFTAKKDQRLALAVRAAATASPLDAVLRLEDAAGKPLAEDDDRGGGSDAQLEWTAPSDGTYRAVVGDRYRAGGAEYVYRLTIRPAEIVGVSATLDGDEYRVEPGKSAAVKVTVARGSGSAGGLVAVATGLPPGVSSTAAEVPEKGGEVILTLTAAADAKPAAGPMRVVLLSTDVPRPAAWVAGCNLRKDAGQELVARTESPWLTVPPAAPPAEKKP